MDEADNLLKTRYSWLMRGETQDKGWMNELLETPGLRMIWITNRIDDIEPSVEEHNYKKPTLIDLADEGSLDQDADLVLLISRDDIIHPFTEHCNRGRAKIIIAKKRRGLKGWATLNYSHQYSLFVNFEGC